MLTGGGTESLPAREGVEARGTVTQDELVSLYRRAACVGSSRASTRASGSRRSRRWRADAPSLLGRRLAAGVCGDAARFLDARSAEAIAEAVDDVLRDPGRYERPTGTRSVVHVEATAAAHEAVYREASS